MTAEQDNKALAGEYVLGLLEGEAKMAAERRITSDADFAAAVDRLPGSQTLLYVDVDGVLTAAQPILEASGAYQDFLDGGGKDLLPIKAVVAGGASTETASTYRVFIEIP